MDLTFRGADVGREALSTVSRYLHEGGVDLDDPAAQALLNELLPTAVWTAIASEKLLDDAATGVRRSSTSETTQSRRRCATSR